MGIKQVKDKNPGWEFSTKVSKKASKQVKANSLKSKLGIDSYVAKYVDQVKSQKDSAELPVVKDNDWKMYKKRKKGDTDNVDSSGEEAKAAFYNSQGEEEASEG